MKWRQVQALPIYMRCCNFFVGLCWGKYFERGWCRLELKGFRRDAQRLLVQPAPPDTTEGAGATTSRSVEYGEVDELTGGTPEDGKCHGEDRELISATMAALTLVDNAFNMRGPGVVTDVVTAESQPLHDILKAAMDGDAAAVATLLPQLPDGISIDACPVGPDGEPLGWNKNAANPLQWAAYSGALDVVALLLDHGARTGLRDRTGKTAWSSASHPHGSPAYPIPARDVDAYGHVCCGMQQCVELFTARAKAGHDQLAAEAKARAAAQAALDSKLTHRWQVSMW